MLTCSKCKEEKAADQFPKDRTKANGRSSHCKRCKSEYKKRYYGENPTKKREEYIQWKAKYPWRYKAHNIRRGMATRDRQKGRETRLPAIATILEIWRKDSFRCYYCQVVCVLENISIDHMFPVSKGGSHSKENLTTCCLACTLIKRDRVLLAS